MLWSREEDTQHGYYRPATLHELRAGLDRQRLPVVWMHRIAGVGGSDAVLVPGIDDVPYEIRARTRTHCRVDGKGLEWTRRLQRQPMRVRFGPFVLDTGARVLRRDGEALHLSPKAFQLLETLVKKRSDAVSKAELQEILWPRTFVVDTNLANLVGEIRGALGDDRRRPRYLRTVHRFGYAFCGSASAAGGRALASLASACRLVWKDGEATLGEGEHVLGRDPDLTLRLATPSVSRRHALIRVSEGEATIEDLGSKNGTYVNGQKVKALVHLSEGDEILAGSCPLKFQLQPPVPSTQTEVVSRRGSRSKRSLRRTT